MQRRPERARPGDRTRSDCRGAAAAACAGDGPPVPAAGLLRPRRAAPCVGAARRGAGSGRGLGPAVRAALAAAAALPEEGRAGLLPAATPTPPPGPAASSPRPGAAPESQQRRQGPLKATTLAQQPLLLPTSIFNGVKTENSPSAASRLLRDKGFATEEKPITDISCPASVTTLPCLVPLSPRCSSDAEGHLIFGSLLTLLFPLPEDSLSCKMTSCGNYAQKQLSFGENGICN
ncbi:hypothetical protein NN561_010023 [Cricetulus griseus]